LREDVTIVPTGGLDKVATFIALLGANKLKMAVLHDYRGTDEQRLVDLMRQKLISAKMVLNASQFRDLASIGKSGGPTDLEDLFSAQQYLDFFNLGFAARLSGTGLSEPNLPQGDRIIDRIDRYLASAGIKLRSDGGFNHHVPASAFARSGVTPDNDTLNRFEELFRAVNSLF
jgi:hypothetical protein